MKIFYISLDTQRGSLRGTPFRCKLFLKLLFVPPYSLRSNMSARPNNYQYKKFRKAVRFRDGNKCRKCGSRKQLHVHHIRTWESSPELRFVETNGITLCKKCHIQTFRKEEDFVQLCSQLIASKNVKIFRIMRDI
jgi:hypothetical protein